MNDAMLMTHIDIPPSQELEYNQEIIDIYKYIIENYPASWQVEAAKKGFAIRKHGYLSKESMQAHENWLDYVERNKLYKNTKCYGKGKSKMIREYDNLARIYNERFKDITKGNNSVKYNIPSEAIKIYEKHYRLLIRLQKKYPDLRQTKDIVKRHQNDYCQKMVETYAAEHYKGDPVILDKAENKK